MAEDSASQPKWRGIVAWKMFAVFRCQKNCADLQNRSLAGALDPSTNFWWQCWSNCCAMMRPGWMNGNWKSSSGGCEGWATCRRLLVRCAGTRRERLLDFVGEMMLHFLKNMR